jgi:hypothetical protein
MNLEIWLPLLIALAAWIPKILELIAARKTQQSQTELNNAQVVNTIMDGGSKGVTAAISLLNEYQESNLALKVEVADLKSEIDKIKAASQKRAIETQAERNELKARIQADLMETDKLRLEYEQAQKQIVKLEDMAIKMGDYIDKMKTAMQEANIHVPLNGELLESVHRLKLSVEERRKLAGGK